MSKHQLTLVPGGTGCLGVCSCTVVIGWVAWDDLQASMLSEFEVLYRLHLIAVQKAEEGNA